MMTGRETVSYAFNEAEIRSLILLLRKHEAGLDAELDVFKCFLEDSIYQVMTIEEAEEFFK